MFTEALMSMRTLMFVSQIRVLTVGVLVTLLLTAKTKCTSSTPSETDFFPDGVDNVYYLSHLMILRFTDSSKCPIFLHDLNCFPLAGQGVRCGKWPPTITASIHGTMLWKSTPIRRFKVWTTTATCAVVVTTTATTIRLISTGESMTGTGSVRTSTRTTTTTSALCHLVDTDSHP